MLLDRTHDECIGNGGRSPLIFPKFAKDLARDRQAKVRMLSARDLSNALLVDRIGIRIKKAYRNRVDTFADDGV